MSLSRKHKKELRKLQSSAAKLWESQQVLVGEAGGIAKEAGRQLNRYSRQTVAPAVQGAYEDRVQPVLDKSRRYSKHVLEDYAIPAAGAAVGSAMSVWDAANDTRGRIAAGKGLELPKSKKYGKKADKYSKKAQKAMTARVQRLEPPRRGIGAGGVFAIILGVVAAGGVIYAAWQTLRADDELWVADDPLSAPDA